MTGDGNRRDPRMRMSRPGVAWIAVGVVALASFALVGVSRQQTEPEPSSVPTDVPTDIPTYAPALTSPDDPCPLSCSASNVPPRASSGSGGVSIVSVQQTTYDPSSQVTVTSVNGTPVAAPTP